MNISNFTNAKSILQKGEKVTMDKKDFINEHEKLVDVLDSDSKEDDKKESKEQKKELKEVTDEKEIKKSIISNEILSKSVSRDELIKSHIGWQFGNTPNLTINKKGSAIKEKLIAIKEKEMLEANDCKSKAEALLVKLNCQPTEEMSEYITDGIESFIKPKVFNWSETYCNEQSLSNEDSISIEGKPVKSPEQEKCDDKREYNKHVESYVRTIVEVKMIDTMINNFEDEKTYSLAVKQATILGF